MRKEHWLVVGLDGNVYMVFRESDDAWNYALENFHNEYGPLGCIANFNGYENAVCIQVGIGM